MNVIDCNHPKTAEDFLNETPTSKRSASVSEILPVGDRNPRDANLKRRGLTQSSISSNKESKCNRFVDNGENQNPNFSTPNHQYNVMKAAIKSSTEKKQIDNTPQKDTPRLKSTLSARNLFAGRDILNQITEFCNELKRLATRAKEKENVERSNSKKSPLSMKKQGRNVLGDLTEREKERKPLLEVSKEKCEAVEKSNVKEKQIRKKRADEAENIPISVDLKNLKRKEDESLLQIRTCPPSPQCFSAGHGPTKVTPLKPSRLRPPERGILQDLEQTSKELQNEEPGDKGNSVKNASIIAEKEARTLDVFWFLKPCALSN
ncbi:hypothetical protein F0562_018702 [Nyssa sinensis]|uniref:Uncharacterized protein n=1 Tax=Nyssa sinensis TaxID=561372 RepID=A0A5J4ZED8_9ASTE|nr:hypothetical protein F0562_018702 [Nyssa sinensis]